MPRATKDGCDEDALKRAAKLGCDKDRGDGQRWLQWERCRETDVYVVVR